MTAFQLRLVLSVAGILILPQCISAQSRRSVWEESLEPARPLSGPADTVSVFIIGDIMLHSRQMDYPYGPFLEGISEQAGQADIAIANMEFPLGGEPYSGYPAFSAPDAYADYVNNCGFNVFLAANNHILDKGVKGLTRTLERYGKFEENGKARFTGISSDSLDNCSRYPLMVNCRGIRLAIVNFTYGTNVGQGSVQWPKVNRMSRSDISEAIARAKEKQADFILALPHWGNEYELHHSAGQMKMAEWLADEGVDAIVGTHPHVVQDSCSIGGVPVFFSIGNAVSNMSAPNTQLELAVTLRFAKDIDGEKTMLRPEVTFLWCSLPDRFRENYATIIVKDHTGRRSMWRNPDDYDRMTQTLKHVKAATGIDDCGQEKN